MWSRSFGWVVVFLVAPGLAVAGKPLTEQCSVRSIHVTLEAPPGSVGSEMEALIETAFADRGFTKVDAREEADAFLTGTVRTVDEMRGGTSNFSAYLSAILTDGEGNEVWRKELKPYRKADVTGTTRREALEPRAKELAKQLAKACNKGWPK